MSHEECLVGLMARGATMFPSALAYGATWNPDLIERAAEAIGREVRSVGCHQGLAPVLDVSRDVRWGRTEETFGEDPYLIGVLATRYVRGLQGETRDLLATLKHFAGHSWSEGARNHGPVHLGWRELNDIFLLPFEMAVKQAHPGVGDARLPRHRQRVVPRLAPPADRGAPRGVGLRRPDRRRLHRHQPAVPAPQSRRSTAPRRRRWPSTPASTSSCPPTTARRSWARPCGAASSRWRRSTRSSAGSSVEKFRLGIFEKPYVDEGAIELQSPATVAVAREVARQGIVVLSNNGVLPIDPARGQRIALIGPAADDPMALLCGYSFPVHLILNDAGESASQVVTPRAAFERVFGAGRVAYERGCFIIEQRKYGSPVFPGDVEASTSLDQTSPVSARTDLIPAAVAAARAADVAVVCVGDLAGLFNTGTVGEGSDADSLDLPGVQQQLLEAVVASGTPVVVVLSSGRPYNLGGLEDKVAAFVMTFAGGQEGGPALVDVLTGAVEPSGRLTVSVPRNVGAVPYYYNHKMKSAGTPIARHFGSRYPFGHGLGYTTFEFADLTIDAGTIDVATGEVVARFTVRNTGTRAGVAVPQVYVRDLLASVVRPVKELKAFCRVELAAGASARVAVHIPTDMLSFTGPNGRRIVEPGTFELQVGASSADIRLRGQFEVTGKTRELGREWRMESRCVVEP